MLLKLLSYEHRCNVNRALVIPRVLKYAKISERNDQPPLNKVFVFLARTFGIF